MHACGKRDLQVRWVYDVGVVRRQRDHTRAVKSRPARPVAARRGRLRTYCTPNGKLGWRGQMHN